MKRGMALATALAVLPAMAPAQQSAPELPVTQPPRADTTQTAPCIFPWMRRFGWRCSGITRCKLSAT